MFLQVDKSTFVTYEDITCFQLYGNQINIMTKAPSFQSYTIGYIITDIIAFLAYLSKIKKANTQPVVALAEIEKEIEAGTF